MAKQTHLFHIMNDSSFQKPRIQSIDLLRGLVMILMTLDHTRDYFHYDSFFFDPLDLTQTSAFLFMTRFVTHFCAPVFVFLAGTSSFFVGQRKSKRELSLWLLKRGAWLILLEVTVIKLAWAFKLDYSHVTVQVIWALGAGMITLAAFIHLPKQMGLLVAFLLIFGHNLTDNFQPEGTGIIAVVWNILHVFGPLNFGNFEFFIAYPVVPWLGLMLLGYYFGNLYRSDYDPQKRLKFLLIGGLSISALFVLLRWSNIYGDASPWEKQSTGLFTFLSFINVSKYPPSLLYLLITTGPTLIFLYVVEKFSFNWLKPLVTIGRVPMFWYILHIYLIHLIAAITGSLTGYSFSDFFLDTWVSNVPELQGYGFSLGGVYLFWIGICLLLYPLSLWYDKYKSANKHKWWLSYL